MGIFIEIDVSTNTQLPPSASLPGTAVQINMSTLGEICSTATRAVACPAGISTCESQIHLGAVIAQHYITINLIGSDSCSSSSLHIQQGSSPTCQRYSIGSVDSRFSFIGFPSLSDTVKSL